MKFIKQWQYLLLLATGLFAAVSACENKDTPAPVVTPPTTTISDVSPLTAPVGSTVTITGTNFSATPASNVVTFGTVSSTVVTATTTQLVVTVPANAGNPITVAANGSTATFTGSFTVAAPAGPKPTSTVPAAITANTTWSAGTVYLLTGFTYVRDGVTLTIEPGTVIKGSGTGTLIVQAGGKLIAAGTAAKPIVFTSAKAIGARKYGDWGGVVLIGKAPTNRPSATPFEGGIEGTYGSFNTPTDNSGTLQYVRIEFGGIALSTVANSEINGLTLYGVGSGTILDHIQVSYSGDDSYEWFGGTVNAKYLVAFRGFDDDFDTDHGFTGKVQFGLSLRDPNAADVSGSNSFESDNFTGQGENPAGTPLTANNGLPLTQPIFANISSFLTAGTPSTAQTTGGSGPFQSAMHLRRNTAISIYNSVFVGWPEGLRLDGTTTGTQVNVTSGALDLGSITVANSLTAVRGGAPVSGVVTITDAEATTFFNTAAKRNTIVMSADIATLLLNAQNFSLTTPAFLPGAASPLLAAANATTGGKLADTFFTAAPYRGAFNTDNWTAGWCNFDPQNTNYDN